MQELSRYGINNSSWLSTPRLTTSVSPKKPPIQIPQEQKKVVQYWLSALEEGDSIRLSTFEASKTGQEAQLSDMQRGHCDPKIWKKLDALEQNHNQRYGNPDRLTVLLCPLRFKAQRRGTGPHYLEPLWIPACLEKSGKLLPPSNTSPWISRNCLEPIVFEQSYALSSIEAVEAFMEKYPERTWRDWPSYWKFCLKFFDSLTNRKLADFELDDFRRLNNGIILPDSSLSKPSSVSRIYQDLLSGQRQLGVLEHLARISPPRRNLFSRSKRQLFLNAARHCGQFSGKYPLAASQRNAVHRFFEIPENDFLCVTGPPGTGKTTMLQGIIASLFVQSAISGKPSPPLIVACGATNQSVMNIIDSLGLAEAGTDSRIKFLASRWLPGVKSYGSFCCSQRKSEEVQGYQLELRDGSGISSKMETPTYLAKAEQHFLRNCEQYFGRQLSLNSAVKELRKQLQQKYRLLTLGLKLANDGTFTEWLKRIFGALPKRTYQEFYSELPNFDTTLRHELFLFATHYWEGRWLQDTATILSKRESQRSSQDRPVRQRREDWLHRAKVTPTFVSTLEMAPRFFGGGRNQSTPPVDVMIFDEAGQISPELGAGCAALATKAIIVGDYLQLEPIWSVPEYLDKRLCELAGLVTATSQEKKAEEWEQLSRRHLLVSKSNLMELAIRSSRWELDSTIGAFLAEHRRSVPGIVSYCNRLAYNKRLEPKRPEITNRVVPTYAYVKVQGIAERRGTSLFNREEAKQIQQWIKTLTPTLHDYYKGLPIDEIVAVLTPFAAQADILKKSLLPKYPEMTIGTVHSLQGSESPIVIFSPVYDSKHKADYFFDRGVNMLNVLVSRARDSLVVVGDVEIFNQDRKTPSALLGKYLFSSESNDITDSISRPTEVTENSVPDTIRRFDTLDEHRELLLNGLNTVKNRIIICSPGISSSAILADRIHEHVRTATKRGAEVLIFTDSLLDQLHAQKDDWERRKKFSFSYEEKVELKKNAEKGHKLLRDAGANMKIAHRIHNKSLVIDEHTMAVGSFNWLSAVRDEFRWDSKDEDSYVRTGSGVKEDAENLLIRMNYKVSLAKSANKSEYLEEDSEQ